MIEENVKNLLQEIRAGNPFGEEVHVVAATKTRTAEEIRRAIAAGIGAVGENRVQEFVQKYDAMQGAERHFIGHLQLNKVKYLVGKADLIHSVDRAELAREIALRAQKCDIVQNILIQINIGEEETKGGFPYGEGLSALGEFSRTAGLRVRGFMAMLPLSDDEALLRELCRKMRALYEAGKRLCPDVCFLSMGMSGDWRIAVECGSNMIRPGTALFGSRPQKETGLS